MKTIDLKKEEDFVEQYVNLRNSYCKELLTVPVSISETKEWLKKDNIELRGMVEDNILCGATILYLNREGEIAFFVREKNKGFGRKLLNIIEIVAKESGLKNVWAWVHDYNYISQMVFDRSGYIKDKRAKKVYCNKEYGGTIFRKTIS